MATVPPPRDYHYIDAHSKQARLPDRILRGPIHHFRFNPACPGSEHAFSADLDTSAVGVVASKTKRPRADCPFIGPSLSHRQVSAVMYLGSGSGSGLDSCRHWTWDMGGGHKLCLPADLHLRNRMKLRCETRKSASDGPGIVMAIRVFPLKAKFETCSAALRVRVRVYIGCLHCLHQTTYTDTTLTVDTAHTIPPWVEGKDGRFVMPKAKSPSATQMVNCPSNLVGFHTSSLDAVTAAGGLSGLLF